MSTSWSQSGPLKTTVTGVEMFKKILDHGEVCSESKPFTGCFLLMWNLIATTCLQAGDNVGLLLRGLKRGDVQRGQVSIPNSEWDPYKSDPSHLLFYSYHLWSLSELVD